MTVANAKALPKERGPSIEYNIDPLPKIKGIKKDNFLGIEARFVPERTLNTLNVIYKL